MTLSPNKFVVSCMQCGLNELCIPHSLSESEMDLVDSALKRGKPLQRGQDLFQTGDKFTSMYAVRSGAFKAYHVDENGEEQVVGFFLPGEILSLDAIDGQIHPSAAKALETSAVCEIPYTQVEELSRVIHNLQSHMYRLLSREIRQDQELQMLLGKKTAEERIGAFLLNLSMRYAQRKLSSTSFRLPMARTDIGNYLGLAVETVSRVFTRFQVNRILRVEGKEVEIVDRSKLCAVAAHPCQLE